MVLCENQGFSLEATLSKKAWAHRDSTPPPVSMEGDLSLVETDGEGLKTPQCPVYF